MPMTMPMTMPMSTGFGMSHMGPGFHTPLGSTAGLRANGFGRFTSPATRGIVTVPPQFAGRPLSTPLFRGTPEAVQFRDSMRQFDAFQASQLRAAQFRTTPFGASGVSPLPALPALQALPGLSALSGLGIF